MIIQIWYSISSDIINRNNEIREEIKSYNYDINDLKSTIINGFDGAENLGLYAAFVRGSLSNGVLQPACSYRVSSDGLISFSRDIILTSSIGFRFGVHVFVDWTFVEDSGWQTSQYNVSANTTFKIVISRTQENTSEIADIDYFVRQITFGTYAKDKIDEIEDNINGIEEKFVNRNPHNLLYGVKLTAGKRWFANASAPQNIATYTLTDFIPVEQGKLYAFVSDLRFGSNGTIGDAVYYAEFDAEKNIILQETDGRKRLATPGANTAFFRLSYITADIVNPIFTYAPFTGNILDPVPEIVDTYKAVSVDEISFKGKNTQFANILETHKSSIAKGMFIANGNLATNANWMSLADYIPCKPSTDYNIAIADVVNYNPSCKITWYAEDGTYISDILHANNTPYTSPDNAKYLRISIQQKNDSQPASPENYDNVFLAETTMPYGPPCVNPYPVFTGIYSASSLYGKKWFAFGDSITEKNIRSTINYHDYIRQETGIDVYNKGVGGSGYKNRWQNGNCMYQLAETASTELSTADLVTCMAGINDAWSELTTNMGEATDVFNTSATAQNQSVMACFNHFLDVIIASAPYAKIGIISPLPCYHTSGNTLYDFKPDNDTSVLAMFIEKCKTACKNRGIPYLDLFHTSGLRPWDADFNAKMFKCNAADSPDGLHPNYLGHKFFYPLVRAFVKTLI